MAIAISYRRRSGCFKRRKRGGTGSEAAFYPTASSIYHHHHRTGGGGVDRVRRSVGSAASGRPVSANIP